MGDGPVSAVTGAPSRGWKLRPEVAANTQGLVANAFAHLPEAEALFLLLPQNAGGAWLTALREVVVISDATGSSRDTRAASIAFTATGLAAMNLPEQALRTFSAPFREGMHQVDRRRRLGDIDDADHGTVIAGGPMWSGNAIDEHLDEGARPAPTPVTVHCALILYELDDAALAARGAQVEALLSAHGVRISHRRVLSMRPDPVARVNREHFGFADGMSQPVLMGEAILAGGGPDAEEEQRLHGIDAGEVLLGHLNLHRELAPGPIVAAARPGEAPVSSGEAALQRNGAPPGFLDLGINGSYLVIRELNQDVPAFWNSLDEAAKKIADPAIDANWLASRMVGRTLDGDPLKPDGVIAPVDGRPANNFTFAKEDLHGFGCPLGSHIRRANPRDSLPSRDGSLDDAPGLLAAANAHRILRRGRKFGPQIADPRVPDGQARGLMFMCLNSDLVRHFEFIQQTWMLNESFATLSGETDPLMGPKGRMTIPACPLRLRPQVQTYVQMAGGEYFFLPGMPALDYLAGLAGGHAPA